MDQKGTSTIEVIAIWLSVVISLTTLGVLIWKGGAIAQTVVTDSFRIDRIEKDGSSKLQAHESRDEAIEQGFAARIENLETAMHSIGLMQADIREIKTRVEFISVEHRKSEAK